MKWFGYAAVTACYLPFERSKLSINTNVTNETSSEEGITDILLVVDMYSLYTRLQLLMGHRWDIIIHDQRIPSRLGTWMASS